eukprot:gene16364-21688_t
MKETFQMFAAYNRWANGAVYDAAGALSADELNADKGAFFGSMIGTLNHLLCADRIWMRRFTGEGEAPAALNVILHADLDALKAARDREDQRIVDWIEAIDDPQLAAPFTYQPISSTQAVTQ